MAKVFASDVAMKVTIEAVQVCGGAGYMRDYPLEKMMRDAKITQIYEGSNEVLRGSGRERHGATSDAAATPAGSSYCAGRVPPRNEYYCLSQTGPGYHRC